MVKVGSLFVSRLFIITLVAEVIPAFLGGHYQYAMMFEPFVHYEGSLGEFDAYVVIMEAALLVLPTLLPLLFIYLFYTPEDLRDTYVDIIVTIFVAALIGYSVGSVLGAVAASRSLEGASLLSFTVVAGAIPKAAGTVFVGFTAATIAYIRRRWDVLPVDQSTDSAYAGAHHAVHRGGSSGSRLVKRLFLIVLSVEAIGAFLGGLHLSVIWFDRSVLFILSGVQFIVARFLPGVLVYVLSVIQVAAATFVSWFVMYLLYTPEGLKNMYVRIMVTVFVGTLVGYPVGFAVGVLTASQFVQPSPHSGNILALLFDPVPSSIPNAVHTIFPWFTAGTVAYIRRRWPASGIDRSMD